MSQGPPPQHEKNPPNKKIKNHFVVNFEKQKLICKLLTPPPLKNNWPHTIILNNIFIILRAVQLSAVPPSTDVHCLVFNLNSFL